MNYSVSKKGRILVPGRAIDADFRRLVIDHMISNGGDILTGYFPGSVSSVADHFKLSRSCVAKLWNGACERASIDPQWKGGNNPTHLHSQGLDLLEALKTAKPSMPYNKILEVINANCVIPSGTSTSAIGRAVQNRLSGGPWTWKRMSNIKYEKFTLENVDYCQDFLSYVSTVDPYKLKFFDEAGFALPGVGKANYGHSAANHPCVEIGRHLGAPNVTLNMLIGLEGVLYANTEGGATDTLAFLNFFDEASQNSMPNGQPILQYGDHVILDNCATHHFEGGYALAESLDDIGVEVVYLPTYSPELNPIELAFNKLKKVAQKDEIREVFARNIHEGVYECLEEITVNDCAGFFKHVGYINF